MGQLRIAIDSDSYEAISGYNWPFKIGYVNGRTSAWSAEQIAECHARGELLALVDVLGNAPREASILDWERGDVQSPDVLRTWVQARNRFRGDAVVYCNRSSLMTVINALQSERCLLWLAEPTPAGEPPKLPPVLGLPPNLELLGVQYALEPESGGHYDISVIYAEHWHPDPRLREDEAEPALIGRLEAAEADVDGVAEQLEPAGYLAGSFTMADGAPGHVLEALAADQAAEAAAEAAAVPTEAPAGSSAPQDGSEASGGSLTAFPRPVPAAALSSSSATAPASGQVPSASWQIAPPVLADSATTIGSAAVVLPVPDRPADAGTGTMGAAATDDESILTTAIYRGFGGGIELAAPAPARNPALVPASAPPLPHGRIQRAIGETRAVAAMLRAAGAGQTAELLEHAAAQAAEVGSLLMRAGL